MSNLYILLQNSRATMLHNPISVHHRRDTTMATLLSSIVVVFLCCHSTKLVTNTYEAYQMVYYGELKFWPPWAEVLSRWNHFMLAVNASINIFIYVIKVQTNKKNNIHQTLFLRISSSDLPSTQCSAVSCLGILRTYFA